MLVNTEAHQLHPHCSLRGQVIFGRLQTKTIVAWDEGQAQDYVIDDPHPFTATVEDVHGRYDHRILQTLWRVRRQNTI